MNFKIVAATLGVIAALSVPVIVAASSSGSAAGTQGNGAGTCVCAGDCTQDQLRLRDGSCGGDAAQCQVQTRTQSCLQAGDCTQDQSSNQECTQAGNCTRRETALRTSSEHGTAMGPALVTRTRPGLSSVSERASSWNCVRQWGRRVSVCPIPAWAGRRHEGLE